MLKRGAVCVCDELTMRRRPCAFRGRTAILSITRRLHSSARDSAASQTEAPEAGNTDPSAAPKRRSRRLNYADYDKVIQEEIAQRRAQDLASTSHASQDIDATMSGTPTAPLPTGASPYLTPRSTQTLSARIARRKLLTELNLYQTRGGVGQAMARWADVRAYTAYLHGSVDFFVRHATSPPLNVAAFGSPVYATASIDAIAATDTSSPSRGTKHTLSASEGDTTAETEDENIVLVKQLLESGRFAEAALLQHRLQSTRDVSSSTHVTTVPCRDGAAPRLYRGLLQHQALDCLYVGRSGIHSRGLFTANALPKGTCLLREPRRAIMAAPSFLRLLADTHQQLPDTMHYTHPTGTLLELVLQPLPHHFFNHSCEANVCCGLSPLFWPAAEASGSPLLRERMAHWANFADANCFFLTRDVQAGEELTLDYGLRLAPMFAHENAVKGRTLLLCRCGSAKCRHSVYQTPRDLLDIIRRGREAGKTGSDACFRVAADLLEAGVDNETVLLSLLPSRRPTVSYLFGDAIPELHSGHATTAFEAKRSKKSDLLSCYRHVFKLLNETVPQTPVEAA